MVYIVHTSVTTTFDDESDVYDAADGTIFDMRSSWRVVFICMMMPRHIEGKICRVPRETVKLVEKKKDSDKNHDVHGDRDWIRVLRCSHEAPKGGVRPRLTPLPR